MSDKRLKLEQAATDAIQRLGLNNLSFRTLADEVGIKSSSVHYYFPEKSDLVNALIKDYTVTMVNKLAEIDANRTSLADKLDAFIGIFEDVLKSDKFCLCGMLAAEYASLGSENRSLLIKFFQLAEDWVCAVLEHHHDLVKSSMQPRALAKLIISGLEGALLVDRVMDSFDRINAQREFIASLSD